MSPSKEKPAAAKLRSWRVSIFGRRAHLLGTIKAPACAHYLGTIEAPDRKTAEDFAVQTFKLRDNQRRQLMIWERG
jgi:hypothetical protein